MQLGAQRNDLFGEMQELLKQQQDEVAACRAALALCQQNAAAPGTAASSSGTHRLSTARLYQFLELRWRSLHVPGTVQFSRVHDGGQCTHNAVYNTVRTVRQYLLQYNPSQSVQCSTVQSSTISTASQYVYYCGINTRY